MGAVGIEETLLGDLVRALPLSRLVNASAKSILDLHCNDIMSDATARLPTSVREHEPGCWSSFAAVRSLLLARDNQASLILVPEICFVSFLRPQRPLRRCGIAKTSLPERQSELRRSDNSSSNNFRCSKPVPVDKETNWPSVAASRAEGQIGSFNGLWDGP